MTTFQANGLPALIGSLPVSDHTDATRLVLDITPEIPLWIQLPRHKDEGMMSQFLPGLPGLATRGDKVFVDTDNDSFEAGLLEFYEEYIAVTENGTALTESRFALSAETAPGFFEFERQLHHHSSQVTALKGQITGPVTLATGISDQNGKAAFYDERLRDAIVKLLALKARWQVKQLSAHDCPVIIFLDEPGLAGFGSSAFISISREEITACLNEVMESIHDEGGLAGIHVCANTEWSLILNSTADIVSFDAYAYFDRFILYPEEIKSFLSGGGILAWGIVPTLNSDDLEKETCDSLVALWEKQAGQVEALGIDRSLLVAQSLITPSCGAGALSRPQAVRALELTRDISIKIRESRKHS